MGIVSGLGVFFPHIDLFTNLASALVMKELLEVYPSSTSSLIREVWCLLLVMLFSTLLHILPRIFCIINVPVVMNNSKLHRFKHLKYFGQLRKSDFYLDMQTGVKLRPDRSEDSDSDADERSSVPRNVDLQSAQAAIRDQLLARLFRFGENAFVPLLFPQHYLNITVEEVKRTLWNQMCSAAVKVIIFSIPQAVVQLRFTMLLQKLDCTQKSTAAIYASAFLSIGAGIVNAALAYITYRKYRTVRANMFLNRYVKSAKDGFAHITVTGERILHEDFKVLAEYWLKHPSAIKSLWLEKGMLRGYDPAIKIVVPAHLDAETEFDMKITWINGAYFGAETETDKQILVDFLKAFPRVNLKIDMDGNGLKNMAQKLDNVHLV